VELHSLADAKTALANHHPARYPTAALYGQEENVKRTA
jgi:hypothetical protein